MKLKRIHEMVVSDILAQGSVIGAEHLLRAGGVDSARLPIAASVKQQCRARRDTDVSYRKEHRAGGLTVAVNAKALALCIIFLDHGQELRERAFTRRAVAHVQGRYGAIGVSRLHGQAAGSV